MPNVRDAEQIRAIIDARGIKQLYHFTQLSNLQSILKNGLLTRAQIEEQGLNCIINDELRLDKNLSATCCSIEFPNYKMFSDLRTRKVNQDVVWVLIELSPDILLEKDCAFYPMNAAKNEVKDKDVNNFKGAVAFQTMFAEVEGKPSRAETKLSDEYPTNPQAEVLVFDQIEKKYIVNIFMDNKKITIISNICPPRSDWTHWQN